MNVPASTRSPLAPLDPAAAAQGDRLRRTRILQIATLTMCGIGVVTLYEFYTLGLPELCAALVVTMAAGLANLALLRRTRRPALSGHIGLAILTAMLVLSNTATGGFQDPNFAWFYFLPLAAAMFVDLRGAAVWLGITLAIALGFWGYEVLNGPLVSRVPPALQDAHALFTRITAVLGISVIASSFAIGQRRAEQNLENANSELRRESAYVQLLEHGAVAANEASSFENAMEEGVKRICRAMGWPVGHIFVPADGGTLRTAGVYYIEDAAHFETLRAKTLATTFASGEGMPGRALATAEPQAFYDLPLDSDRPRAGLARQLGIRTAFAIPVLTHGRVAAVLEFGARERLARNDRLLEVLAAVGVQIGRVAERTALQQRLRQSQKMEATGRLAAGVAHEINNPMAYVRSNLTQLRTGWGELRGGLEKLDAEPHLGERLEELEELLHDAIDGVERTVSIVRDMKEFSHVGGTSHEPADVNEIVASALRVAAGGTHGDVSFETCLEEPLPPLRCAANQLHQVFVNLIVNAVEALEERGRIRVTTRREGDALVVGIEDDGPGMDEATRERLFDPFFTTKPAGKGTGLGLAISYEIARDHGGEIRAESEPGVGTRMEVHLPYHGPSADAA